ncbi:MAG: TonB-dependent receptor plug domain-containing protein [Verrucomicrobiota bacterium JB022]|nr:TonB-dependent receptor plug domain-containing protein [Verrucomicrobiota bacterium JB022]
MSNCNVAPLKWRHLSLLSALILVGPGALLAQQTSPRDDEQVFELSPFEVQASEDDVGYYASSTLAGTRMNSQLKDLASAITVVTAQQLQDTAATDLNDVFLYEASTEGTHTYTSFSTDRSGAVTDNTQQSPTSSNRMRGLGSVDIARNYYVGIREIPLDSYNVEALTIQRGPNSVLYGLGSPSGLVNSTPSRANIGGNKGKVEFRLGSWGDVRTSFDYNATVLKDKLAIRVAALYHDKGIQQEPAFDRTRRQYATVTYEPWKGTTIRASYEHYDNEAQRAASITAMDLVTPWIEAGRPAWNPTTLTATYDNGRTETVTNNYAFSTWTRYPELYKDQMPGLAPDPNMTNAITLVDRGQVIGRWQGQLGTRRDLNLDSEPGGKIRYYFPGVTGPNQPERLFTSDGPYEQKSGEFPGYITPGVSDKSIYDYEELNLAAANFFDSEGHVYEFSLEQKILDNLFVELGYHREQLDHNYINDLSSGNMKLRVDVNTHNLDGTVNENFGRPFMDGGYEPRYYMRDQESDTWRGTVAWNLDFTENDNSLISWLGRHNIMGLAQFNETSQEQIAFTPRVITKNPYWMDINADGTYKELASQPNPVKNRPVRYYMGDNSTNVLYGSGQSIQYGYFPSWGDYYGPVMPSAPLRHFVWDINSPTKRAADPSYPVSGGRPVGAWETNEADWAFALTDNASHEQQKLTSYATAVQSFFWEDRIVTTLGWRYDKLESRQAKNPGNSIRMDESNGYAYDDPLWGARDAYMLLDNFPDDWTEADGTTTTKGVVVHPFLRQKWAPTWLEGFSVFYNESDSFEPAQVEYNLYGEILPDPNGEGQDYGFTMALLDNKLHVKVNWYEQTAYNARHGGDTTTMTQRLQRMENESNWGVMDFWEWNIELRDGLPFGTLDFFDPANVATQDYVDELYELARYPVEPPVPLRDTTQRFNDVRNVKSKGTEFTIDYNPTSNLNIKIAASKQESIIEGAAPATAEWAAQRYTVWTTMNNYDEFAQSHGFGNNPPVDWWNGVNPENGELASSDPEYPFTAGDPGLDPRKPGQDIRWQGRPAGPEITNVWIANGLNLLKELDGKPTPQYPEWRASILATYRFTEGPLQGFMIGGSARWEDKKVVGWAGELVNGELKYDVNRPFHQDADITFDMWAAYRFNIGEDLRMKVQLNVRDVFESGGLEAIRYNPNGSVSTYRIVSPRTYYISTSLEF